MIVSAQIHKRDQDKKVLVGRSSRMAQLNRLIEKMGHSIWPVLILGETGTGKEVVARSIHQVLSDGPFVTIDCSSMVGSLMESELFGYTKGAFTGAATSKAGLFEMANGGTAFLDEIGELPLDLQAKLLRVLQEKEFRPLGGLSQKRADFRVIAATNRDLGKEVEKGTFRRDLYYRLNVVTLRLPPLRDRTEDVLDLIEHFMERYKRGHIMTPDLLEELVHYDWPGNVRELENTILRMVAVNSGPYLSIDDLPSAILNSKQMRAASTWLPTILVQFPGTNSMPVNPPKSEHAREIAPSSDCGGDKGSILPLSTLERQMIKRVMQHTGGDRQKAAALLGIGRTTLYRKLKDLELEAESFNSASA